MDSLVNIKLCNHHLDLLQFFECYHMFLNHFLLLDHKNFFHQSQYYNLLFPQLVHNFLDHFFLKMIKQKVYLLLENLDQLKNLNICFALDLFFWIDFYSN